MSVLCMHTCAAHKYCARDHFHGSGYSTSMHGGTITLCSRMQQQILYINYTDALIYLILSFYIAIASFLYHFLVPFVGLV